MTEPVQVSYYPAIAESGKKVKVEVSCDTEERDNTVVSVSVKVKNCRIGRTPRSLRQAIDGMRLNEVREVVLTKKEIKRYKLPQGVTYQVKLMAIDEDLPDIELKVDCDVSDEECKGAILFMHGWPDDENVFAPQREFCLKNGFKCMYYTLPWFGPKKQAFATAKERNFKNYGYGHTQLVDAIAQKAYGEVGDGAQFYIVGHDWGAYHAPLLKVRHPHLVKATVQVDVEGFLDNHFPSIRTFPAFLLSGVAYQYMNIWAHHLSQLNFFPFSSVADAMNKSRGKFLKKLNDKSIKVDYGCARSCYVYTKFRSDVFRRMIGLKSSGTKFFVPGSGVKTDNTNLLFENTLFVYGKKKLIKYHGKRFEKMLNGAEEEVVTSAAVGIKGAGHYVSLDAPDELNTFIVNYFEKPEETCAEIKEKYTTKTK